MQMEEAEERQFVNGSWTRALRVHMSTQQVAAGFVWGSLLQTLTREPVLGQV